MGVGRSSQVGHDTRADRVIPPGLRPAAAPARPSVLVLREGCGGIRLTGKPPRLHLRDVRHEGCGFFGLHRARGLGLLRRSLTRRYHHTPERLRDDAAVAVLHLHLADDALPMPAAERLGLRPARLLHEAGQGGLLAPPGLEFLPYGTGARHERHQAKPVLQTQAQGPAPLRLTVGDNPAAPI